MLRRVTLAVGVVGSCVVGVTQLWAQSPKTVLARDLDCLVAALGPLVEIDFEGLPHDRDPRSRHGEEDLPNPLEIGGVTFTDSQSLDAGFCSWPTCSRDPDNRGGGNIVLFLNPGSTIDLPPGTGAVILDIQGIGDNPFSLRATDVGGNSVEAAAAGIYYDLIYAVFTSSVGLSRIEVIDVGGTRGPLALAALFLGNNLSIEPPRGCENPPAEDLFQLVPRDSGSVLFLPELGILDKAPVCSDIQSTYFRTTEENREFRRGFIEFAVPDFHGEIVAAKLILTESRGTTTYPLPLDRHELSYYAADLEVSAEDFGRPTTSVEVFETDASLPTATFAFDVTRVVQSFRGQNLGFRIKLGADPDFVGFGWLGSGFGSLYAVPPVLEIRTALGIEGATAFRRGDCNDDGSVEISDAVFSLSSLFLGDGDPGCEDVCDSNDDGTVDISDAIATLGVLFLGNGVMPLPGMTDCGVDPTDDEAGCETPPKSCQQ